MCCKWYPQEHWMGSVTPVVNLSVCLKPATSESVCVSTGTCCCPAWPLKGQLAKHESNGSGVRCSFCLCSFQAVLGRRSFAVSGSLTSWERGGWTGWPQGSLTPYRGRMRSLQLWWSLVLAIWKSVTKSRSHHLKNSRTMRNAQPWAWCCICQRELLVWKLVRWLLQQDHGKFDWYFLKIFAFLRQRVFFFQWQSKVITLNKPLA